MRSMGRRPYVLAQSGVEEGIRALRMLFPKMYFDESKTGRLLECLKRYQRMVHQKTGEPMGPLHDEHSHGADCARYIAMAVPLMRDSTHDYIEPDAPDWRM